MGKNSFLLYTSDYKCVKDLPLEQKGALLDAIFEYASTGTIIDLPPVVSMAFNFFRYHIDDNTEKWNEKVEKRRAAGRLGGLAKAENSKQSQANLANLADNVNDNDNVNVSLLYGESVREEANKVFDLQSIKEQLLSDETWKESVCMQSTLGVSFISMLPDQLDKFIAYIIAIGEERSISNISDAKRRFTYWWQNHGRKEVQDENRQVYTIPS